MEIKRQHLLSIYLILILPLVFITSGCYTISSLTSESLFKKKEKFSHKWQNEAGEPNRNLSQTVFEDSNASVEQIANNELPKKKIENPGEQGFLASFSPYIQPVEPVLSESSGSSLLSPSESQISKGDLFQTEGGNETGFNGSSEEEIGIEVEVENEDTENGSQNDRIQELLDSALQLYQEAQQEWEKGNSDGAIEMLDRAYELLVSADAADDANLLQQKDDLRFLISKRMVEIYASRQRTVNGTHNEIPLTMNDHVKREIASFLGNEKNFFCEAFKKSGLYLSMITQELREAGLPEKLCWLPLIESYFKNKALSRARALGLWQFIPSTGYKFGLKRDKWVDERMDPQKSTRAAIEYLTELHKMFGDWSTALAAYNCGEGKVLSVIKNQHINYLDNFWDLYERLPRETARYVPRFIAAISIIENKDQYPITLEEPFPSLEYEEISINKQVQLKALAEKLGIDENKLTILNSELRYEVTPDYEYRLKVPPKMGEQVLACLPSIPPWTPTPEHKKMEEEEKIKQSPKTKKPKNILVKIKSGDTLSKISKKYNTSVKEIMKTNHITNAKTLRAGQNIYIPGEQNNQKLSSSSASSKRSSSKKSSSGSLKIYKVQKGDYPFSIAKNYNMRLNEFLTLNGLSTKSLLYPGQRVLVKNH